MKVMVIGGGGREHAIIKKIKENPEVTELYALPGNGGIAKDATCVDIGAKDIEGVVAFAKENGIEEFIVHAPYIINLASTGEKFDFAVSFLKQELERIENLGFDKVVLHPGSHVNIGVEEGIKNIITGLNLVLKRETKVKILLETMAGKGTECGRNFEEIKQIIDGVEKKENIGVCLDTCHIHDGGYDVSNFDEVLKYFDEIIGLNYLYCVHINDSKNEKNSHKDRHENLGLGYIGFDNLIEIIYHEKLKHIPKILETPFVTETDTSKERLYPPYKVEIDMIKNKKMNANLIEDIRLLYK